MDTDQLASIDAVQPGDTAKVTQLEVDKLSSGLDWQGMFPMGTRRMALLRILRDALIDTELMLQDVNPYT